jgi:hypothetical protein
MRVEVYFLYRTQNTRYTTTTTTTTTIYTGGVVGYYIEALSCFYSLSMDDKGGPLVFQEKQHTLSALGRAHISSWKRSETSMWDVSHDGSSNSSTHTAERERERKARERERLRKLVQCCFCSNPSASGNS